MQTVRTTARRQKYDDRILVEVARLFFLDNFKQEDIVKRLRESGYNISQSSVSRLIDRARNEGIVQIAIRPTRLQYLEMRLNEILTPRGIREVIVVPAGRDRNYQNLGDAGAEVLLESLRNIPDASIQITMSSGATLTCVITSFFRQVEPEDWERFGAKNWKLYPSYLIDDDSFTAMHPNATTAAFAAMLLMGLESIGGLESVHLRMESPLFARVGIETFLPSLAPGYYGFSEQKRRKFLLAYKLEERILEAKKSDIFLLGIGNLKSYSGNMKARYENILYRLDPQMKDEQTREEFVAETDFQPIRRDGSINHTIERQLVGVGVSHLRKIRDDPKKHLIAISGGPDKTEAVEAALVDPYFNRLVTDQTVAEYLLSRLA